MHKRKNTNRRKKIIAIKRTSQFFVTNPGNLIEWCFTLLSTVFQSYYSDSSNYSCLSWVSPVLGWGSKVFYPRTLPRKNPEDPVRLEPRTPGLRVKHFTTEPRRTPTNSGKKLHVYPLTLSQTSPGFYVSAEQVF